MPQFRVLVTAVAVLAACSSSTAPVDPTTAPVAGRYALTSSVLKPGQGGFDPGNPVARNVISDVYALNASGGWSRVYHGTETDALGTRAVTLNTDGTYERAGAILTFRVGTTVVETAQFTGTALVVDESDRTLTYTRQP